MTRKELQELSDFCFRHVPLHALFSYRRRICQGQRATLLSKAWAGEALIERVVRAISNFTEVFKGLEPRQQKAQLQTALKAATICKDGRIELEFRGESGD